MHDDARECATEARLEEVRFLGVVPGFDPSRIAWLRDRAYPMIKGAAEFYRHFPNVRKEADGKYHIHHVNSNESVMGAHDTDEDLSAMRGIFAAAIRASEVLGQDLSLRTEWQERLANLAPAPRACTHRPPTAGSPLRDRRFER